MSTIGYINVSMETFGGVLSLIFVLCLFITRPQKERMERLYIRLLICNTALLFSDAAAWLFKGRINILSFFMVRISNFFVFTLGDVMLSLFTHYLVGFLETKGCRVSKAPLYVIDALMLLGICLSVISQFNNMYYLIDEYNVYHRQSWFGLSQIFGIVGMLVNSWLLFQIIFYSVAVLYLATTICLLCIYISIQVEQARETAHKKVELETAKTAVMLSQIQPHFLYNALTGIKTLCGSEPERAEVAMEHFSYFLRSNLDSLSDIRLIPFDKEINISPPCWSLPARKSAAAS